VRGSVGAGRLRVKESPAGRPPAGLPSTPRPRARTREGVCYRSAHPARAGLRLASLPFVASVTPSIDALAVNIARAPLSAVPADSAEVAHSDSPLVLGIGCRRSVTLAQIEAAVRLALGALPLTRITAVATLDAKADEPALRAFCAAHALPLQTYTREQIAAMPALAPPSAAAQARYGVDGVCEPCARLAAGGGPLLRGKLAHEGVTVAIANKRPDKTQ
jgi:cobalt-precorrin 5A hydrolase